MKYVCMYIRVCMHVCMYNTHDRYGKDSLYVILHTHTHTHTYIYIYTPFARCQYMPIYVCMYVCTHWYTHCSIHTYVYMHFCHGHGHACETLAVMYLQRGPPIAENKSTTHRTHRTHRMHRTHRTHRMPSLTISLLTLFWDRKTSYIHIYTHVRRYNNMPWSSKRTTYIYVCIYICIYITPYKFLSWSSIRTARSRFPALLLPL